VVHLKPLPGSPGYDGLFLDLLDAALADARSIEAGGAAALIVENFGDAPFYPDSVPPETVAAMTRLVTEIRKVVRIPVGVNVLRNDARSSVAVAAATGAGFIRVNVHTGVMVTDQGILAGRAWESLRLREILRSRTLLLADVRVKHAEPLVDYDLSLEAEEAILRGRADGLIVTGPATGRPANLDQVREIRGRLKDAPVLVGSGVDTGNIEAVLQAADGCIVGTAIKAGGRIEAPVDVDRVRELAEVADRMAPRSFERQRSWSPPGGPPEPAHRERGGYGRVEQGPPEYLAGAASAPSRAFDSDESRGGPDEGEILIQSSARPAQPEPVEPEVSQVVPEPADSGAGFGNGPASPSIQFGRGAVRKKRR
jgi:membrane complex biogenesis BtpA family protein